MCNCNRNDLTKALFESVQAGIVLVDADSKKIIDVNPAACVMIGSAREDIIGQSCTEYLCAHSCDGCPLMTDNLSDGTEENKEIVIHRRDGSKVFALLTINSVILKDGEKDKRLFINSLIDITKQKESEEQIHRYWAEAEGMLKANIIRLKNGA